MATNALTSARPLIRHNYLAILAAGISSFVLEAVWYSVFLKVWLAGIDRTMQFLHDNSPNFGLQLAVALASAMLMAFMLDCAIQLTGPQTAARGMKSAHCCGLALFSPSSARSTSSKCDP